MGPRAGAAGDEGDRGALTARPLRLGAGGGAMVGVGARSGREPGASAGARHRDNTGGGGANTCLQPGLHQPPAESLQSEMETTRLGLHCA